LVTLAGGSNAVGKPGVIAKADPSPDGHYALIVESHHPYSYELPFENFPKRTEVVDLRTGAVKQLSNVTLADDIPLANDAVETGPRDYECGRMLRRAWRGRKRAMEAIRRRPLPCGTGFICWTRRLRERRGCWLSCRCGLRELIGAMSIWRW
jgi:hypothetical protein